MTGTRLTETSPRGANHSEPSRSTRLGLIGAFLLLAGSLIATPGLALGAGDSSGSTLSGGLAHGLGMLPTPGLPKGASPAAVGLVQAAGTLPASVDLSAWDPPVGNQGAVGSCASWATGYYYRYWLRNHMFGEKSAFAPMYLYSQLSHGVDAGSTIGGNIDLIESQGIPHEADYSQGYYNYKTQPTPAEVTAAAPYKATSDDWLFMGVDANSQTTVEAAMAAGAPVVLGIPVYSNFMSAGSAHPFVDVPSSGMTFYGDHAVFASKYDASGVWIENSWGTGWGKSGWAELSWAFVDQYAFEGWTMAADDDISLAVSGLTNPLVAGAPRALTVTAKGDDGITATGYRGTVHFTSTDPKAILPADYTFTAADAGVHDFTGLIFETTGSQTVQATDTATEGDTGSQSSIVIMPVAASLAVSGFPSQTVSGDAHDLTVTAVDQDGDTAADYTGTVHFTSSDPKAVLPADYTFTVADAGVHVFSVTLNTSGSQSVTATDTANASIKGSQSGIVVAWPASYTATSPRRILDTRATVKSGNPTNIGLSGVFKAGTVRRFSVAGAKYVGGGTAPAVPANAVAVSGNLTVVGETAAGVIDLGPAASASGTTSTLSFLVGDTRANNVTVGLAADGSLAAVYRSSTAGATANLIFDVTGYFLPGTSGASYHTVTPGRILDTRPTSSGTGATHIGPLSKLPNRTVRSFPVAGVTPLAGSSALVPSAAVAVTGNLTVTDATSLGYAAIGPTMTASPSTSTVNVAAGTNVANGVTVALYGGKLSVVWCGTTGSSADVIFDVTGFFTAGPGGLSFYALAPVRLLDSSLNTGLKGPFTSRSPQLFGVGGTSTVPSSALAIAGNLTLLSPTANGWALVSPAVVSSPTTSTVNASKGHSEANGFDVALGSTGQVALEWAGTTGSTANLALDVTGYWK